MIIQELAIKNFRCLRELQLTFEPLTALLGRNGVGKSCIIHAIDIFYNTAAQITDEDFYNRDISHPIEITLTYGDLRSDELTEFNAYISNRTLTITKRITKDESGRILQKYHASILQYPRFAEIRIIEGALDKRNAWNDLVDSQEIEGLQRARSAANVEIQMADFESNHPELLVRIEKEEQFFGPPNVGGGKLDNYTRFVLVPAVKDVSDELAQRRGSSLYQLLDLIVLRKIETREDIVKKRAEIQGEIIDLYKSDNLPELRLLGSDISILLTRVFPGAELILDWDDVVPPSIPLPSAKSRLIEDGFEGDINKKGHGLQRALLITLLQYLAQLNITTVEQGSDTTRVGSSEKAFSNPSLIIAVEEPELYLHPLRCKYLSRLFSDLTQPSPPDSLFANQIIFTSHSPHFVDLHHFENIRIIRKIKNSNYEAPESCINNISVQEALGRLAQITRIDRSQISVDSFKSHIIPVMSSITSEGFFADAVVLVEGFGDVGIFMKLQEILGMDWLTRGIALIPIEGKTKLDRPTLIFQGMNIPTYLIFDGDKQNIGTNQENNTIQTNHILLRLVGAGECDFPVSQIESNWAIFEYTIDHEIKSVLGKDLYNHLCEKVANEFGMNRSAQVIKSLQSASALTGEIYNQGYSLSFLEAIVKEASKLVD
jgi:putative ATP-dependent endonuclease of OLD family